MREVATAEEAPVRRKWRRVGGGEDEVAATVDVLCFADSKASPKHEDDACALLSQSLYGGIGEEFPSAMLVRACLVGAYGECGVE